MAAWEGARAIDFHHTGNREVRYYIFPVATFLATTTSKPCHLYKKRPPQEGSDGRTG